MAVFQSVMMVLRFAMCVKGVACRRAHQPPTAPPLQFTIAVRYSAVGGFQLPSQLHFDEGNLGMFDYDFRGCAARTTAQGEGPATVQP